MKKILVSLLFCWSVVVSSAQVNTDRVMMIGRNALYFEDYVLAIQYFNQVIEAKNYLAEPYYFRAVSKFMLDDFKGAEEDASACLQRNPYYTAAYQLRGAARQNQEKYAEAAGDYQRSLEFIPEDRLTLVNMAIVNIELKQYDIADKFFDVLLRRYPDYTPGYLSRAQMALEQADTTRAFTDLNKAIEIAPYLGQSFAARAYLYFQQKEYDKALADFDEAIKLDPFFEGNYINRGLVRYHQNDLRGAMADYDKVIEMDNNNLIARFNRGLLRAQVADNNNAIEDFDKVLELEPDNKIALLNRAVLYNEIGNKQLALRDLSEVLNAYPDFFTGYYMRSQIKRELNDLRGAERDYMLARAEEAKARKKATFNPEPLKAEKPSGDMREQTDQDIDKFNLLVVADKSTEEKSQYQRQSRGKVQNRHSNVELQDNFVLTYYEKAFDVQRPVYFSEMMEKANHQLSLNHTLRMTNNDAPLTQEQVASHFASIESFSKQIADNPSRAALYFGRGMDYALVQDYESAVRDFTQAIELDKTMLVAWYARALVRTKQVEVMPTTPAAAKPKSRPAQNKDYTVAPTPDIPEIPIRSVEYDAILRDYEAVINIDKSFIYAYYNRAEIFYFEKDYRAAIADYTKALAIEPRFAEAYFNRGICKLSIGETESGLDDLRKAGELGIVDSYSIIKRMQ